MTHRLRRPDGARTARDHRAAERWCAILLLATMLCGWPPTPGATQGLPRTAPGLPRAAPREIGLNPAALPQVTVGLQRYIDRRQYAGMVAVIARHGRVGYLQSIGFMNREQRTRMRPDAVFRIYSLSKPIIAVATLQLVEQGKLSLDDPVARYVSAFADIRVEDRSDSAVSWVRPPRRPPTIRDLLTHTAGLAYGAVGQTSLDSVYRREGLFRADKSNGDVAARIASLPLMADPGTKWSYGMGFEVLGAVIEAVTGKPLDRYLDSALFIPLRMRDTGFHITPAMHGRVPVLYGARLRPSRPLLAPEYLAGARFFSGGGGLLSTPQDYLRFAQMLLNGGTLDGVQILQRESVEQLMRNQLDPALTPIVSPMVGHQGYGQGLGGVVLVESGSSGLPGSDGIYRWWGSAGTYFWIDPQAQLIALVWTQSRIGRDTPMEQEFQRLVYRTLNGTSP